MAGVGQRFVDAGYLTPKPLLEFDGQPIIQHIINLFPGEEDFTFICNKSHLEQTNLADVLKKSAPHGKIVGIDSHKLGPVYTVSSIFDQINGADEAIIHYCDVAKFWDYPGFVKHVHRLESDGALSAHRGFHPHMLRGTNYALIKANGQSFEELVEKKLLEDINREYVSDGLYYFSSGDILAKYFQAAMDKKVEVNGEYYASVVYNLMKKDGLKISVYESQHLISAQNPLDYEDYQKWSKVFRSLVEKRKNIKAQTNSVNLIPLAGRGSRFANEGYTDPKPLIEVSGKPMIVQASDFLPEAQKRVFVCLDEHLDKYPLEKEIKNAYPKAQIVRLDEVTEGQACTCEAGLKNIDPESPLMIGACDNGMIWNEKEYQKLIDDKSVDAIAWTFKHDVSSILNPNAYAWLKTDKKNNVSGISIKKAISNDPYNDHAFIGAMYFRRAKFFTDALKYLYKNNIRINGEFYLDSTVDVLIKQKHKVKAFEVDSYIGWGTPNDLKTFEYWQSFFHKCAWHPYRLEKDPTVDQSKIKKLDKKYTQFNQKSS
jgi:bifunctional N-acetylglucosamine-1-phosphate-uridyltransferase/glucosamine-1-phosphate-acetyltransferase GlmU-like protein